MQPSRALIEAMAAQCRSVLQNADSRDSSLPKPLQRKHLLWMCNNIEKHAEDWPDSKLHRWIGFVQCGIMANQVADLQGLKRMFDQAKIAHGGSGHDEDLIDHLNVDDSFELDLGGQG